MRSLLLNGKVYQGDLSEIQEQLYDDNDVSVDTYDFVCQLMLKGITQANDEDGNVFYEYTESSDPSLCQAS